MGFVKTGGILWIAPLTTTCLGIWQLYRLHWKRELIKNTEIAQRNPPIEVKTINDNLTEFTRVSLNGSFIHEKEMLVGLRNRVSNDLTNREKSSLLGYLVLTPFKLKESGDLIIVNRGFMPKAVISSSTRKEGIVANDKVCTFNGMIRKGEPTNQLIGIKNNPEKNEWCIIDLESMANFSGAAPFLVEMTDDENEHYKQKGLPLLRTPKIVYPNNHLLYAITW